MLHPVLNYLIHIIAMFSGIFKVSLSAVCLKVQLVRIIREDGEHFVRGLPLHQYKNRACTESIDTGPELKHIRTIRGTNACRLYLYKAMSSIYI